MDPRMQELDEKSDREILGEIISLMGKLNAQDLEGHVKVMSAKAPEAPGQESLEADVLPGEEASEVPDSESDESGLEEALESAKEEASESDEDEEDEMRRNGRIF
jgi:hypothetical protein